MWSTTGEAPQLVKASQVFVEFADGNQVEAEVRGLRPRGRRRAAQGRPKG
jgi:hypothetical protein